MVPLLITPTLEARFQLRKVDYPANRVDVISRDLEFSNVVVAVKEFALATVLVKSVASAKLNATHNLQVHVCLSKK